MGPVACTARTPAAGVRTIDTIAAEINGIKEQVRATVVSGAIEIGRRLKEAKSLVPYGEWGAWLERSVDYSERTAQNMMRIADEYGKTDPQALADLSVTQAVLLLGVPAEERGAFLAENDVPSMSTRELQAQIEALREEKKKMQLTIDELMQGMRDGELTDELVALQGDVGMMTDRAERAVYLLSWNVTGRRANRVRPGRRRSWPKPGASCTRPRNGIWRRWKSRLER